MKAVFLDRDNTLIANDGDLGDPASVRLIPGVGESLRRLREAGYHLIVVTNQGGVARGKYSEQDVERVHERLSAVIDGETGIEGTIERFVFCPFHPDGTVIEYRREHPWRKPAPGMLIHAAEELEIDLRRSWMVGDQHRDVEAGQAAGCRTILVAKSASDAADSTADICVASIGEAAQAICTCTDDPSASGGDSPPLPESATRIVVEMPSWLGDAVMATPAVRAIRSARPDAVIMCLARPIVAQLVQGLNEIDEIITVETKGACGVVRAARALRARQPEAVLLLPNSFRSALGARLSGCPVRVGYARDRRAPLLTRAIEPPDRREPVPAVDYYADLTARAIGASVDDRIPRLATTESEVAAANACFPEGSERYLLLNPGANRSDKRWPAESFARVADELCREFELSVAVTGAPSEQAVVADTVAAMDMPAVDLVKRGITIGALKVIVDHAALLITNDTGPRHIAAGFETPCVALFGPTDHRWTTLPIESERVLVAEPFLPDKLMADRHAELCSVARIPVSDVLAAARTLLAAQPE